MKKFFEYPIDSKIKKYLQNYYQDSSLEQHSKAQDLKTSLKLERIEEIIKFNKTDIILDIGCSRGYLLKQISNRIRKGVGVDISKEVVELAKKENKKGNIQFFSYDGNDLSLLQNKFDKILLIDVLEHVFEPDKMLENIFNLLNDNGQLVIEVPFTGFLSELITKPYHEGHLRYFDPGYLKQYLEKFKFKVMRIETYNSVPLSSKILKVEFLWKFLDFLVNLIPSKYYPYFGEIIVVAIKNEK